MNRKNWIKQSEIEIGLAQGRFMEIEGIDSWALSKENLPLRLITLTPPETKLGEKLIREIHRIRNRVRILQEESIVS